MEPSSSSPFERRKNMRCAREQSKSGVIQTSNQRSRRRCTAMRSSIMTRVSASARATAAERGVICASDEDRRTKIAAPTLQKATTTAFHDDVGLGSAVWAWRTLWLMMGTVGAYGRHLQKLTRLQAVLPLRRNPRRTPASKTRSRCHASEVSLRCSDRTPLPTTNQDRAERVPG